MPVPQLLGTLPRPEGAIQGDFLDVLDPHIIDGLRSVRFNSVFCLGVFFDTAVTESLRWQARYFPNDPVIRYVAIDNAKRGDRRGASSLVVQSHVGWAEEHLDR